MYLKILVLLICSFEFRTLMRPFAKGSLWDNSGSYFGKYKICYKHIQTETLGNHSKCLVINPVCEKIFSKKNSKNNSTAAFIRIIEEKTCLIKEWKPQYSRREKGYT